MIFISYISQIKRKIKGNKNKRREIKVNFITIEEFVKELKRGKNIISTLAPSDVVQELEKNLDIGIKTDEEFFKEWKDDLHSQNIKE